MASLLDELIQLLKEQKQYYEELVVLSTEKKNLIIANDLENIQKITTVENILVSKNLKLEEKFTTLLNDVGTVLGIDEGSVTVMKVADTITNADEKAELIELANSITTLAGELQKTNKNNMTLIQTSLDYIEFSMNVLQNNTLDNGQEIMNLKKGAK